MLRVYLGVYNVAADEPHGQMLRQLLETVRAKRSVTARANEIQTPPLSDPALIAEGAEHYSDVQLLPLSARRGRPEIRSVCIRSRRTCVEPSLEPESWAEMFWTIKHGIKMSAMPAWGTTHDNQAIWNIVSVPAKSCRR